MADLLIPSVLFLLEIGAYIVSIFLAAKQYRKTRYLPYLILILGFLLVIISSIFRFSLIFTKDPVYALNGYRFLNAFLLPGIIAWVIGFIFFRFDRLPFHAVLIAFLGGFTTAAFVFSKDIKVYYDEGFGNWNAAYPMYFFLFIGPLIIISLFEIVNPLIRKAKLINTSEERRVLYIMAIGLGLILFWGILAIFTFIPFIRYVRPFLLPFGWLIWALGASKYPLLLSFSSSRPLSLLITYDETSTTIFNYVFEKNSEIEYNQELAGMLLSALSTATAEILGEESDRKIYQLENKIVIQQKVPSMKLSIYLLATGYDRSILAALTYFSYLVSKRTHIPQYENVDFTSEVKLAFSSISVI